MAETPDFELSLEEVEQPSKMPRFASLTDDEVSDTVLSKRVPESTRQSTTKWLRAFRHYLDEKDIEFDPSTGGAQDLAHLLSKMDVELRQETGEYFRKSSLLGFCAVIQRRLSALGRDVNIFEDSEFKHAKDVLDAYFKKCKREGDFKASAIQADDHGTRHVKANGVLSCSRRSGEPDGKGVRGSLSHIFSV